MKTTYVIHETQNLNSVSPIATYYGTLRGAKMVATREQTFQGTTLKITNKKGYRVASKAPDEKQWFDYDDLSRPLTPDCEPLVVMMDRNTV